MGGIDEIFLNSFFVIMVYIYIYVNLIYKEYDMIL